MQRVKMLKTMCGPKCNRMNGKEYTVDFETAKAWVSGPDPIAMIIETVKIEEIKEEKPKEDKPKAKAKPKVKTAPKFVPGVE